jgi:hypothetical protein
MQDGKVPTSIVQHALPSGMYLPNLPFQQQQNLFSFSDFQNVMRDAGKVVNDVAQTGQQVSGVINQFAPQISSVW